MKKLLLAYIIPIAVFITFFACGIWIWSSYVSPWGYSYSNDKFSATYTFYDKTYIYEIEYADGRQVEGKGTFETYSDPDGKYIDARISAPYPNSGSVKTFKRTSAHSLITEEKSVYNRLLGTYDYVEAEYINTSALVFEIFCGLIISISGVYLIIMAYLLYKKKVKIKNGDRNGDVGSGNNALENKQESKE